MCRGRRTVEVRCFGLEHLSPAYRICGDAEPQDLIDELAADIERIYEPQVSPVF